MAGIAHESRRNDVGCPFCGLICDDLTIEAEASGLRVAANGCPISQRGFESGIPSGQPSLSGSPADLDAAVDRAAAILGQSRAPAFAVAADIAGARAALRLADRLGGIVDHPESDGLFGHLRVQQDAGAFATTFSELRNRADVVLLIGPDPSPIAPRFFERCTAPQRTLLDDRPLRRHLFRLGPDASEHGGAASDVAVLTCPMDDLPKALAALLATLRGSQVGSFDIAGLDPAALGSLAERLASARYAVLVWAPALFNGPTRELAGLALLEIVRRLNRATRCAALALGGGGNLIGVNQLCIWQTGFPLRTSFGGGAPDHDPYRFSVRRMVDAGEADALVWIDAFGPASPPDAGDTPTVVFAPSLDPGVPLPAVHIPVGVPGLDHPGQVFRADVVVALKLDALRAAGRISAGAAVDMVEAALDRQRGGR